MAANFYELKSHWENCSVSKNISTLRNGSENSSVLKNGSYTSLQHDFPFNTIYTSQFVLSRGLENTPMESRMQETISEERTIQKNNMENISQAILEVKSGSQGSGIVENPSPVFSRDGSPNSGETADASHESDKEEVGFVLESDSEGDSKNDSTNENVLSNEFLQEESSLRRETRLSEFCESFSEHLRELESSLKFDSPEKWLFTSMVKRNSDASETSFEELSSCQSEVADEISDEFVVHYESDSSNETEQLSRTKETLLPTAEFLSELNKRCSADLVGLQGSSKKYTFTESSSNISDIEDDTFSDSASFDLPFGDFSGNLLSRRLLPKETCRRSNSSCDPKPSRSIQKSTQFQMKSKVLTDDRSSNGKPVNTHRRTSSLVVPLSSVEVSRMRDSPWIGDLPQVTSSTRTTELTHVTCASQVSNMSHIAGLSWTTASTQMTDLTWMTDSAQMTDSMAAKVQTESIAEEQKRLKMAIRRGKVIKEILDTEVTYQTQLALVIKFFERPLRVLNILSDHVVVTIFGNIEQLMAVNTELLIHLKSLSIGEAFRRLGPFLKLYSTYANNHERALAALMEWDQKSPEFARFRRTQEDHVEMKGLKLNALLITPVQRIPRYKLLLEDFLTSTPPDHEDYANIEEAVKQISAVANHINEHIKQQDNFMKMLAIQRSLTGPLGPKILIPGRIFIKEGPLRKVSNKGGRRSHERMFYLFSDVLMYAKPRFLDGTPGCNTFMCCCILPLHHCKVNQVFGHSQGQGALFTVQCKEESLLLFSDQKTINSWINALQLAIDEVQTSRQSLRKTSSAKEPMRGGAIVQFLKREKKTDPLVVKNNRSCEASKQRTKHQQKNPMKSCLDEHENIHPNESATASSTQKKHRLGFGCLQKRRRQIFPDVSTFASPKSPSFPKDKLHSPADHRFTSADRFRSQSGASLPTRRDENRSRPAAATGACGAEESRLVNSIISSDPADDVVLLPQHRRHQKH